MMPAGFLYYKLTTILLLSAEGFKNQLELILGRHHTILIQNRDSRAAYPTQGIIYIEGYPIKCFELEGIKGTGQIVRGDLLGAEVEQRGG